MNGLSRPCVAYHCAILQDFSDTRENKVELHFVDGQVKGLVDITTTAGRIMLLISGDQAYEERASLLEAMLRGRRTRVLSHGRPLHGRNPRYGWNWIDERDPVTGKLILKARMEVCEPEAANVRRMYDEALHGATLYKIVHGLMADGVPNTIGEPRWNNAFVRSILRDQRYMGVAYAMVYQKVKKGSTVTRVMRPEDGRVLLPEGTYPPIVSAEVWHAVQNRLTQNKLQASRNNRHPESALLRGGFVACAECGSNMIAENRPGDYADYLCARTPWNRGVFGHPRMRAAILACIHHVRLLMSGLPSTPGVTAGRGVARGEERSSALRRMHADSLPYRALRQRMGQEVRR
jgi:hypothetical protein